MVRRGRSTNEDVSRTGATARTRTGQPPRRKSLHYLHNLRERTGWTALQSTASGHRNDANVAPFDGEQVQRLTWRTNDMSKPAVIVDINVYFRSHFKKPSGRGLWIFESAGKQYEFTDLYSVAKAKAKAKAAEYAEKNRLGMVLLTVMP